MATMKYYYELTKAGLVFGNIITVHRGIFARFAPAVLPRPRVDRSVASIGNGASAFIS